MRRYHYAFLLLGGLHYGFAQAQQFGELNINNVRARFYANGLISADPVADEPNFEIPIGENTHPMYAAGLWIGGIDLGNQLRLAAIKYEGLGEGDWYTGPLNSDAEVDPGTMAEYDHVWTVNAADVAEYQAYCTCLETPGCDVAVQFPGYVMPSYFNDWPAIGDVGGGYDLYQAPFVDHNGDGDFNPADCDAPCGPGDQFLYFVFNDHGAHLNSGGQPIGVQVQTRPFAYSGPSAALAHTVFVEYRITNKSTVTLTNTYLGLFTDFDIGCANDDYIGCDVKRSMWYAYNGDDSDENCNGSLGYGGDPPAFGAVVLCGPFADYDNVDWVGNDSLANAINGHGSNDAVIDNERLGMSRFMYFNNFSQEMGDPTIANHYYDYMRGRWKDGTPLTYDSDGYGDSITTRYAFPHNSDPFGIGTGEVQPPWSEVSEGNAPGDRRGMGSMGPFTLEPGMVNRILIAFTYARANGGGMASVTALENRVDNIRQFASEQNFCDLGFREDYPCFSVTTGIDPIVDGGSDELILQPIPAHNELTVTLPDNMRRAQLLVFDAAGRAVLELPAATSLTHSVNVAGLATGHYVLEARAGNMVRRARFVKE